MIGQTLRSRYKIIQELLSAVRQKVYLAEDTLAEQPLPPKYIVRQFLVETMQKEIGRLFREAVGEIFQLANYHSQIPDIIDYFEDDRSLYLVEEAIEGHPLSQEVTVGRQWSEADTIELLKEILELVALLHQQKVIHLNLCPENVWRRQSDGKLILTNFGNIERVSTLVLDEFWQATSRAPVGIAGYMPSEQYLGVPKLASDLYAVGAIAIFALTGIPPYQLPKDPDTLEIVWRDRTQVQVSEALVKFLNKLICYDFNRRYLNAEEALEALMMTVPQAQPRVSPLPVQVDQAYGYQDRYGKLVIQPEFNLAYEFVGGLAAVKVGKKWGYINEEATFVISPKFDQASTFSEGLARVQIGSKYGYINRSGEMAISPQFSQAMNFHEGLAAVAINDQWHYIDKTGNIVISPPGDRQVVSGWASHFSGGLARFKTIFFGGGHRYGFIDKTGQVAISPEFEEASHFSQGLARVKIGYKWGFIDKKGQIAIALEFDQADDFYGGFAAINQFNKWGLINQIGQLIIEPKYDKIGKFSEHLCPVKMGYKWGYIDVSDRFVIPPQYDLAFPFINGLALVNLSGNRGYIDKMGNFIKR
ncbi:MULTISPECIES: WG repeat-containing protein [Planktothricoides]|uniref:WG repeat-containing protein n=2 Tax=Planktothricoides raciborskii TaxID=132608 RepID=A0AAU8JEM9_9CYAN|nr:MULTISPECIES: WG repeat-containing protein [Planktothricoides]MBD2546875.1 WG repeat-containing protein [Planktothricoides raciborskii FACHB-1370]MBD2585335.1 WG repeat-containing protein [Planktothricoides raciborskii FACHB-1261]